MNDDMSLDELATLTGETLEELRRWQELGLLPVGGPEDRVSTETAERVRLIQFAIGKGLTPEEIGRVNAEQDDLLANFTPMLSSPRTKTFSLEEAADISGIDREFLDRMWRAMGMHDQPYAYQEDLETLRWLTP